MSTDLDQRPSSLMEAGVARRDRREPLGKVLAAKANQKDGLTKDPGPDDWSGDYAGGGQSWLAFEEAPAK